MVLMVSGGVFVEHQRFIVSSHAVVEFFDPLLNPLQVSYLCHSKVLQAQQTLCYFLNKYFVYWNIFRVDVVVKSFVLVFFGSFLFAKMF